jgi:hypothetical protein
MNEYSVYKMYLALKLHFTTDSYDVIANKGRVRASKQAFAKRKDLYSIKKISKTYTDEEVVNFLVSNFVSGDRWGGMFDSEAGERYTDWKRKIESLSYIFKNDLEVISSEKEVNNIKYDDMFKLYKTEHPYIIKMFLRKDITLETLVILEKLAPFVSNFDNELSEDLIWPDISRLIKKYKPFLKIDKEKYNGIFTRVLGH